MRSPYLRTERCRATVARGAGGHRVAAVGLRCERGAGRGRRGLTSACSTQASWPVRRRLVRTEQAPW